jgi:hypothetical protein
MALASGGNRPSEHVHKSGGKYLQNFKLGFKRKQGNVLDMSMGGTKSRFEHGSEEK